MIKYRRELNQIIDLLLPAVEVGVAEGLFSADMLSWGLKKLYMVDAWQHLEQFGDGSNLQEWHDRNMESARERVKKYGDKAVILRGKSVEMAKKIPDNSLGLVYIDCDHSYQGVKMDIEAYWPKLVNGGIMAFHDYENNSYGVKRAVEEFALQNKLLIALLPEDKQEDAGAFIQKK